MSRTVVRNGVPALALLIVLAACGQASADAPSPSQVPSEALLARIAGTDVWYRSFPARADARFVYELSPNDNLIPWERVTDWGARTANIVAALWPERCKAWSR